MCVWRGGGRGGRVYVFMQGEGVGSHPQEPLHVGSGADSILRKYVARRSDESLILLSK